MKIIEQYSGKQFDKIEMGVAKYIGDYAIRIIFKDGTEKLVDFKSFLSKSQHPSISKYFNEELFSHFKIVKGNLDWNDHDLIFPIWDLYSGRIEG